MSKLGQRAINACKEYDNVKREIDRLTSEISKRFADCESRQRKKINKSDYESQWQYWDALNEVNPCISFGRNYADYNCDDCKKALEHIRKRKELRQKFGIAKRKIRAVARSHNKVPS